jgi:hypothetical protein
MFCHFSESPFYFFRFSYETPNHTSRYFFEIALSHFNTSAFRHFTNPRRRRFSGSPIHLNAKLAFL